MKIAIALILLTTTNLVVADWSNLLNEYRDSCGAGNIEDCFSLSLMYESAYASNADQAVKDKLVFELHENFCKMNVANYCTTLGTMYESGIGVKEDKQKALQNFNKSCDLGDDEGCKRHNRLK